MPAQILICIDDQLQIGKCETSCHGTLLKPRETFCRFHPAPHHLAKWLMNEQ